jgi:hypothetical protein
LESTVTDPQRTLIAILLDRPGSTESIKTGTDHAGARLGAAAQGEDGVVRRSRANHHRPGTVTVVVLTDGHENASVAWTNDVVQKAIGRQETDFSWDFVFLGANMDAVAVGQSLGFAADKSITYAASPDGVDAAFTAAGNYVSRRRSAGLDGIAAGFSNEDRRAAVAGKD